MENKQAKPINTRNEIGTFYLRMLNECVSIFQILAFVQGFSNGFIPDFKI